MYLPGVLSSLDLSKEMELLQNNRALGGPRHHHTVVNLFQETRQLLADIVYLVAAQSGLPKEPTDWSVTVLHVELVESFPYAKGYAEAVYSGRGVSG